MKKRIRFVVYPGPVTSATDGQRHMITAAELMGLYKVNPRECIVHNDEGPPQREEGLIALYPKYDGDYRVPH